MNRKDKCGPDVLSELVLILSGDASVQPTKAQFVDFADYENNRDNYRP